MTEANLAPGNWARDTYTGVRGGIPSGGWKVYDVTDYGADPTGAAASDAAVAAARDAGTSGSPEGSVIYFPAGTYKLNGGLSVNANQAIRGAGMFDTTLVGGAFSFGNDPAIGENQWPFEPHGTIKPSTFVRGATQITVDKADNGIDFQPDKLAYISIPNDPTVPIFSTGGGYPRLRRYPVWVTEVGGTPLAPVLTLDLPVPMSYSPDFGTFNIEQSQLPTKVNGGIEGLTLDAQGAQVGIALGHNVYGGWVLDVRVRNHGNYGIFVENSTRVTVRGCFIEQAGGGSNHSGILVNTVYGGLIENNIVDRNGPGIEVNHGTVATAFVNNLFFGNGLGMDVNHGPHNHLNLYENNITSTFMADGYFGGASNDLVNRNWLLGVVNTTFSPDTGLPSDGSPTFMAALKRGSRNYVFVNNLCGTPGYSSNPVGEGGINLEGQPYMGNSTGIGTASLLNGDPWFDWDAKADPPGPKSWKATYVNRLDNDGNGTFETAVVELDAADAADFAARLAAFGNIGFRGFPNGGTVQNGMLTGAHGTIGNPVSLVGQQLTFTLANSEEVTPAAGLETLVLVLDPGAEGFAEFDLDVLATTKSRGNADVYGQPVRDPFAAGETARASYMDGGSNSVDYMTGYALIDPAKPPTTIAVLPAGAHYLQYIAEGRFDP